HWDASHVVVVPKLVQRVALVDTDLKLVVARGDVGDVDPLTIQAGVVHVGPASTDALIFTGVLGGLADRGIAAIGAFEIFEAKGLLVARRHGVVGREQIVVGITQKMIVAVTRRPYEIGISTAWPAESHVTSPDVGGHCVETEQSAPAGSL